MARRPDESVWWMEHGEVKCQIWDDWVLFADVREFVEPIIGNVDHCEVYSMDFLKRWLILEPSLAANSRIAIYDRNYLQVPEPILLAMTLMDIDYA